jgi:heme/copper-type cytochrome/quinol oxidase subunit 4
MIGDKKKLNEKLLSFSLGFHLGVLFTALIFLTALQDCS